MTDRVRFGIIGTGAIAGEFADGLAAAQDAELVAVASRDAAAAERFAAAHGSPRAYGAYEDLLGDPAVEAVYVATPHPQHPEWAFAAIEAGKHVLCEKPIAVNTAIAERIFTAATARGVVAMEAFAFRFHPQTQRLLELIRDGAIGRLRGLAVAFTFDWPQGRAVDRRAAGGGILDVGTYCTSMAALIVAAAQGGETAEVEEVRALAELHPVEQTDLLSVAVARYPDDVLAQFSTGVGLETDDYIRVYGTAGKLAITKPCWRGPIRDFASDIVLTPYTAEAAETTFAIPGGTSIFTMEADGVARIIREGPAATSSFTAHSLANLRALDAWRSAVGVAYDEDIEAGLPARP